MMSVSKMRSTARPGDALETIPGVGPSIGRCLRDLGYSCVDELRGENAARMYYALCELRGTRIDRCVLYVFRCAVYYASNDVYDPDLLRWWNWKDDALRHSRGASAVAPVCDPSADGVHECCE